MKYRKLLPIILFGISIFIILYVLATLQYPGGNQYNPQENGFSWLHNYWCNLLDEYALNGQPNKAKPIALVALVVLSFSVTLFWYYFFSNSQLPKKIKIFFIVCGSVSMGFTLLLFTRYHNQVIPIAVFFGIIALMGTFWGLTFHKKKGLLKLGLFNLFLVIMNGTLYYSGQLYWLPLVQKIGFLCFLIWVVVICLSIRRNPN